VYGGGIEEPYQRTGSGTTAPGWQNEFETIRIPLKDFQSVAAFPIDLSNIVEVRFDFASNLGSVFARAALDDLEVVIR
jgi:hypothetical protein